MSPSHIVLVIITLYMVLANTMPVLNATCTYEATLTYIIDESMRQVTITYPANTSITINSTILPLTPMNETWIKLYYIGEVEFRAEIEEVFVKWPALHYYTSLNGSIIDLYYNKTTRLLLAASTKDSTLLRIISYRIQGQTCSTSPARTASSETTSPMLSTTTGSPNTAPSNTSRENTGIRDTFIMVAVVVLVIVSAAYLLFRKLFPTR